RSAALENLVHLGDLRLVQDRVAGYRFRAKDPKNAELITTNVHYANRPIADRVRRQLLDEGFDVRGRDVGRRQRTLCGSQTSKSHHETQSEWNTHHALPPA